MRTLAVMAALAGCSSSIGEPCSLEEPCGEGAVCDLSSDHPGVCIDAEGDLDGDGLRNDRDFCHGQPGGAYDEDRDGIGDDCDRCPIAPPPATPDRDNDGVDSPCDPEPTLDGDQLVVFEGFNGDALPAGWQVTGPWELRGGEVVISAGDSLALLTAPLPLVSNHMAVLGQYRIDATATPATQNFAGVAALDRRPAGVSVVQCGGSRAGAADSLLLDSDIGAAAKPFDNLFDPASLYRVAQKIDNTVAACAMVADAQSGAVQQATGGEAPTEAGLVARNATVRFQYLLVVQRPSR
ncbi:MAG: hypothetical protein ACTHU0_10485 [Kofleriaceae bacterium]